MDQDCGQFVDIMKNSISLVCQNALSGNTVVKVEGLLGVTLEDNQILLVNIHELFGGSSPTPTPHEQSSSGRGRKKRAKKRKFEKIKIEQMSDGESVDDDDGGDDVDGGGEGEHYDGDGGGEGEHYDGDGGGEGEHYDGELRSAFTVLEDKRQLEKGLEMIPVDMSTLEAVEEKASPFDIISTDHAELDTVSTGQAELDNDMSTGDADLDQQQSLADTENTWPEYNRPKVDETKDSYPDEIAEVIPSVKRSGDGKYICPCGRLFLDLDKLRYHSKNTCSVYQAIVIECDLCRITFKNRKSFLSHNLKKHGVLKDILVCHLCSLSFRSDLNLAFHLETEHSVTSGTCPSCSYSSANSKDLHEHVMMTHTKHIGFKCCYCFKEFQDNAQLREHVDKSHFDDNAVCIFCNKHYSSLRNLRAHVRTGHGGSRQNMASREHKGFERVVAEEQGPHWCEDCGAICKSAKILAIHKQELHKRTFRQACEDCGKVFRTKLGLKIHMDNHTSGGKYQCHICAEKFNFKSSLEGHLNKHTNTTPYKCSECEAGFHYRHSLHTHEQRVHAKSMLTCPMCDRIYLSKQVLASHCRKVHKARLHFCKTCEAPFRTAAELQEHCQLHRDQDGGEILVEQPVDEQQVDEQQVDNRDSVLEEEEEENFIYVAYIKAGREETPEMAYIQPGGQNIEPAEQDIEPGGQEHVVL